MKIITYPAGLNKTSRRRLAASLQAVMHRRGAQEYAALKKAFGAQSRDLLRRPGLSRKELDSMKNVAGKLHRVKPDIPPPYTAHNPSRYFFHLAGGEVYSPYPQLRPRDFYGPDAATKEMGGNFLYTGTRGVWKHALACSYIGFFYDSPADGTVSITAQVRANARSILASDAGGYTSAAIRIVVLRAVHPSMRRVDSRVLRQELIPAWRVNPWFHTSAEIPEAFATNTTGVRAIGRRMGYSVTLCVPLAADATFLILVETHQEMMLLGDGVALSNVRVRLDSVSFSMT